jgi:dihydrofolate synthase/folylpolyglutamate synthase
LKSGGVLVTGELPDVVEEMAVARAAEVGTSHRAFGRDFHLDDLTLAVGGWSMDVEGIYQRYPDVFFPMHGRHQAGNAAIAIAAVEELIGKALPEEVVREGLGSVVSPGRIEVVGRDPIVVLDGAHNPEAFAALASTLEDEFPALGWTLVIGSMGDKDLGEMLSSMDGLVDIVIATAVDHERAFVPGAVAAAVAEALPSVEVTEIAGVANAIALARESTPDTGGIVIAGSLYLVGEARSKL